MNLSKSIDFLLENAGDVIKYRLHKEILKDLNKVEEENLLEKVFQTPYYKLVESYVKPNGYIGSGMHSWSNWRGMVLHETPLQDGEAAARLLSNYAIPKNKQIIINFIAALRSDEILKEEFSYIPPEIARFRDRYLGINSGYSISLLNYTCQALLGYGDDDEVRAFTETSYNAFESVLHISALSDITKTRANSGKKYNYPYIEQDMYFPCQYHLETLAHTTTWRNDKHIETIANAINHLCEIMEDDNLLHVKIGNKYYAPCWAYVRPFKGFTTEATTEVALRKTLTHLAMVGGDKIDVVRKSADVVKTALEKDGVLRVKFDTPYHKKCFKQNMSIPSPYSEISLETSHKSDIQIWCDLTFWAVQLIHILNRGL